MIRAEAAITDSQFDKEKAEERIAKLGGAIGRIKVQRGGRPEGVWEGVRGKNGRGRGRGRVDVCWEGAGGKRGVSKSQSRGFGVGAIGRRKVHECIAPGSSLCASALVFRRS
jgi:hypothetical protein